jgi:hypothetical protein
MSECQGSGQISPLDPGPGCRRDGVDPHCASVLQESRETANIDASWGFIWGIPVEILTSAESRLAVALAIVEGNPPPDDDGGGESFDDNPEQSAAA